jgi:hypothetical protein
VKIPGLTRVDWREDPKLWVPVAWAAGVAWPGIVLTLPFLPPSASAGGFFSDFRFIALIEAAVGVALAIYLLARERRREQTPRTRLGVVIRFLVYGAVFSVVAQALLALILAPFAPPPGAGFFQTVGSIKTTLWFFVGLLPFAVLVGFSYALWAGAMAALIAFAPRPLSLKPRPTVFETFDVPPPPAPPAPEPEPTPPAPETELEKALRPDPL